jgi:predicted transcriptional regulator
MFYIAGNISGQKIKSPAKVAQNILKSEKKIDKTSTFFQACLSFLQIKKYIRRTTRTSVSSIESKSKLYTANGTRHE